MKKIASFCINHDTLTPGIYTSRVDFKDIITYDIRFVRPNAGSFLSPAAAHTVEHIFASWVRSGGIADRVIYFGPMGCLTGFYLVLKDVPPATAVLEIINGMKFVSEYEGAVPGAERAECGNYAMHDLPAAKKAAKEFCAAVAGWTEKRLAYPE